MCRFGRTLAVLAAIGLLAACDLFSDTQAPGPEPMTKPAGEEGAAPAGEGQPAAAAEPSPAEVLLDKAIEARGGLDKLKTATTFKGQSKGTYMGMAYRSQDTARLGEMRMDITMADGQSMSMVMGLESCWNQSGKVVMPCNEAAKKESRTMMAAELATWLWPLKEESWELSLVKEKVGDAEVDALQAKSEEAGVEVVLVFDPEKTLLQRSRFQGIVNGQPGEIVVEYSDYQAFCDVQTPSASKTTFAGKPCMDAKVSDLACGEVDEAVFAQPEQVADGTIEARMLPASTLACITHKGPYDGIGPAMGKLMEEMGKASLAPMGPAVMIYKAMPPKVKKPAKFVTDLCFPVGQPAPKKPKKMGALTLVASPKTPVLGVYGLGDYSKRSGELAVLLSKEIKGRKLKPTGPMRQLAYSEPGSVPAEQMVSEMLVPLKALPKAPPPVKGKPKAKGKAKKTK